ncbi:hypothetical protein, partial [Sphingobium sp. AM]
RMAILTEHPAPRSRRNPEPPPTCPFINQQCQRASPNIRSGQPAILELSFEDLAILDIGDRSQRKPEVITASVEWHLGASNESVNRKNRILENFLQNQGRRGFGLARASHGRKR